MQFVWWLTGVLAVIAASRFVWLLFKKLTSKENLNAILDRAEEGLGKMSNSFVESMKDRKERKKAKKQDGYIVRLH